jgi:hypothetical protein
MVDKLTTSRPNVVDFMGYQQQRRSSVREQAREQARVLVASALAASATRCRHCGAALAEGESEDECSSAFNVSLAPARFRAIPER